MTFLELRSHWDCLGARLSLRGDRLAVDAPTGALTPEIKASLADHKPALLALLADPGPPPVTAAAQSDRSMAGRVARALGTTRERPRGCWP